MEPQQAIIWNNAGLSLIICHTKIFVWDWGASKFNFFINENALYIMNNDIQFTFWHLVLERHKIFANINANNHTVNFK